MSEPTVTKHTPGPWTVNSDTPLRMGDCFLSQQVWASSVRVAFVESQNVGLDAAAANARLIAAAPELLALVRKFRRVCEALEIDPSDANGCSINEQADILLARIAGVDVQAAPSLTAAAGDETTR